MAWLIAESRPDTPAPAAEYRRQARRLRCHLSASPVDMQRALLELAKRTDGAREADRGIPHRGSGIRGFAEAVAAELEGPVLRYSGRQKLVRNAARLGISRFDANLIIAAVQHRIGSSTEPAPVSSSCHINWCMVGIATCVSIVQLTIAAGVFWMLH